MQGVRHELQKRVWLDALAGLVGREPRSVLDVGTGSGFLALLLAEMGHRVKGLDLSPGMVEQTRKLAAERGIEAAFDVGDAEALPEPDAAYDAVVSRNVLWTLPHPEKALAEWKRVLKPGGRLVLVDGDWFDNPPSYRVQRFLGKVALAVTRFRNPWAGERRLRQEYDKRFDSTLPLKGPGNRRRYPEHVAQAGFADVQVRDLTQVDRAERVGRPLGLRLLSPHRFFAVTARKP